MLHLHFIFAGAVNDFMVGDFPAPTCLDGRAVQGARLKFESLLEAWVRIPLQAYKVFLESVLQKRACIIASRPSVGHWSSGMILL